MLYLLTSSLLLAAQVLGQTCGGKGKSQGGQNNYVVDEFTGLLFTYAIDRCTGVDLLDDTAFAKYTCTQDNSSVWWVTKSTYTTKTCSGTATSTTTWDNSGTTPGAEGYFKCDGGNNYAHVQISIDTGCAGAIDVYGGLGGCAVNTGSVFDTKFYCNSTNALVQLYNPGNETIGICSDDYSFCTAWNFQATCGLSASLSGTPVYGKTVACETSMGGTTVAPTESSAKSQFTILGAIVTLVVALFH